MAGAEFGLRPGRALTVGSVALAVALGVAFGQVTGSLSDTATGARDLGAGGEEGGGDGDRAPGDSGPGDMGLGEAGGPPSSVAPDGTTGSPATTGSSLLAAVPPLRRGSGPTTTVAPASDADVSNPSVPANPVPDGGRLTPGQRGSAVRALQERLGELGYWAGEPDGAYREPTRQAVLAFQKAEGLEARDGIADAEVGERLAEASFAWGRSRSGRVIEVDRERQLLLVVEDGAVRWTLNAATGDGLRRGTFTVEREIDARYDAPLVTIHRPKYFDGAVAIQGTGEVPAPPAQGCACLSDAAMDLVWSTGAGVGTEVLVY